MRVGKDVTTPNFNGYMTQVTLRLGPGSYCGDKEKFKTIYMVELPLPEKLKLKQDAKSTPLIKEQQKVLFDKGLDAQEFDESVAEGKYEYAVSGWARWIDPPKIEAWHLLFRLSVLKKDQTENISKAGDRTLAVWKGAGYFHLTTYTCNQENGWNINMP